MKNTENKICSAAEFCGGCFYQGVNYDEQVAQKNKGILRLFDKHDIDPSVYKGLVPALSVKGYRNKMEYTFGDFEKGEELCLGLHRKGHFMSIITTDECQLVPEDFNKILSAVLEFARERCYSFYHRKTHEGLLRNLVLRHGVRTNELLVNIVTSSEAGFDEEAFVELLEGLSLDNDIIGILRTFNDSFADAVIPERVEILRGRDYYNEVISGLKFKVNAFSFFQTNIEAIERLYREALMLIPYIEKKTVFDLYCGTGTISQLMAGKAEEVYGIEILEDSVNAAIDNAELNGIKNCKFICGDVKAKLEEMEVKPDVIVVDPPRVGMADKVVDMLTSYGTEEILYISCNPKTLCINLERFALYGYVPKVIKAYDNFSMTKHVECVVLMSKANT